MLPHLPLSYLGEQYQFRQADGSHNNVHYPDLGKSGTPYARALRSEITSVKKPDAGLLFDLLMSRGSTFNANGGGTSSLLVYYGIIISHDISLPKPSNPNINDSSSYLDLSPLYGNNQEEQKQVRLFQNGLLKPDTFQDSRALTVPPGVAVLLVMFNRFHNYAATTIAAINENGRFTPPTDLPSNDVAAWRDEQIFQVSRMITIGLYVNIITHDYIRAMLNISTADPSITPLDAQFLHDEILFKQDALSTGNIGNHVSIESTFLYRLYSLVSERDAVWLDDLYVKIFPKKPPHEIPLDEFIQGLLNFAKKVPGDPSQWIFGELKRSGDGTFSDADLVKILVESVEDPAGRFGVNHIPDVLRPLVLLAITETRKWQLASLNQYRKALGLRQFQRFDEINPDPDVAQTLQNLYRDIDQVELYPGIAFESVDIEPSGDSVTALESQNTVIRGLLSDLTQLVGRDRFLTQDYTPASLTSWGYKLISSDYTILFGSKIYLLILNALPRYIAFNSVYAMQPFFTPPRSREILKHLEIKYLFSFDAPSGLPTPLPIPVTTWAGFQAVLTDQKSFPVPWGPKLTALSTFMLASDTPEAAAQKKAVGQALYGLSSAFEQFEDYSKQLTIQLLNEKAFHFNRAPKTGTSRVDIVKDIANLVAARFVSRLCYLPLNTDNGTSYTDEEMYKVLGDSFLYIFADSDPTLSWVRRRDGGGGTATLVSDMEERISPLGESTLVVPHPISDGDDPKTCPVGHHSASSASEIDTNSNDPLEDYGIKFAKRLLATGRGQREVVEILVGLGVGFVANAGMLFSQLIDFYLREANAGHWAEIKKLSADNTTESDDKLTRYILEGYRLSNTLALLRLVAGNNVKVPEVVSPIPAGNMIFLSFFGACMDQTAFPDPLSISLDRPIENYPMFSFGPHSCLGRQLNLVYCRSILKVVAGLPGLRRAPGEEGKMHFITSSSRLNFYLTPDWSSLTPLPTTMTLEWDA